MCVTFYFAAKIIRRPTVSLFDVSLSLSENIEGKNGVGGFILSDRQNSVRIRLPFSH